MFITFMVRGKFYETSRITSDKPDINSIGNLWGILAREECKNETQCANEGKLTSSIEIVGKNIFKQTLIGLSETIFGQLIRVVEKKVIFVKY